MGQDAFPEYQVVYLIIEIKVPYQSMYASKEFGSCHKYTLKLHRPVCISNALIAFTILPLEGIELPYTMYLPLVLTSITNLHPGEDLTITFIVHLFLYGTLFSF